MNGELVDDDEVGDAGNGVVSPLGAVVSTVGSEETGQDHDDVGDNGDEDVGTAQTGEEGQVQQQEWGGDRPIHVTGPVDLTIDVLGGVGNMLVGLLDGGVLEGDPVTHGHSEVRDGGEGGDEGSQDVEQAFLLRCMSIENFTPHFEPFTYHGDTERHGVECHRGDDHDHTDNPAGAISRVHSDASSWRVGYHRVRLPVSPAVSTVGGLTGTTVGMGPTELVAARKASILRMVGGVTGLQEACNQRRG